MTTCKECGGDGRKIASIDFSGDVPALSYVPCPVCGPIFESLADGDCALWIGCRASSDEDMNLLFNRSEALFDAAVERCDRALHEVAA
jgi:hypothetical protein